METIVGQRRIDKGLVVFLCLNFADCIVTWIVLAMGGVENNWYKFVLDVLPVYAALSLKMLIVFVIAYFVFKYKKSLFKPLNIGMALILAANMMPLFAYLVGRFLW